MGDDKQFVERLRAELNAQVEAQSPRLQGRLRAARREVLQTEVPSPWWGRRYVTASVMIFTMLGVSLIWFQFNGGDGRIPQTAVQTAALADQALLNEGDELEFYRDLEFYYWLEQEGGHAS